MSRERALGSVKVGDLIFGRGAGGQDKLLLVYEADPSGFSARHVTTQVIYRFDTDGVSETDADGGYVTIVSLAGLPPALREVALGLDRKFAGEPEYPDTILTDAEINLLLNCARYFEADMLPGS